MSLWVPVRLVAAELLSSTAMVMASSHKEHNIYYTRASRAKFTCSIIMHSSWLMECLYYAYGSTANFLFLGPTALIYISNERCCNEGLRGVGILLIKRVIR